MFPARVCPSTLALRSGIPCRLVLPSAPAVCIRGFDTFSQTIGASRQSISSLLPDDALVYQQTGVCKPKYLVGGVPEDTIAALQE